MKRTLAAFNLATLRRAGRFAEGEDDKPADPPADGGEDSGSEGEDDGGANNVTARISTLVEERNAARTEAQKHQRELDRLRGELDQLKQNDQSKVVTELQEKLSKIEQQTSDRFDKLLETELALLPEAAAKAVNAIPGGPDVRYDWLVSNRALFSGKPEGDNGSDKKGVAGPQNDRKPPKGDDPGASSVAKAYVESRKPKAGFPGLTG
jgi:TolA-binding protein